MTMLSTHRWRSNVAGLAFASALVAGFAATAWSQEPAKLPERLSDAEYWSLISSISEPGGYFRIADNFTSNEREIGQIFTMLRDRGTQGGVYMGVGPEQNLTYIAAIRPQMAFIVDIRRQAVMQHLMFKAMFGLSKDRGDFISILFGKPRPAGIDSSMSSPGSMRSNWRLFSHWRVGRLLSKDSASYNCMPACSLAR